jgi:hypothetical protein
MTVAKMSVVETTVLRHLAKAKTVPVRVTTVTQNQCLMQAYQMQVQDQNLNLMQVW